MGIRVVYNIIAVAFRPGLVRPSPPPPRRKTCTYVGSVVAYNTPGNRGAKRPPVVSLRPEHYDKDTYYSNNNKIGDRLPRCCLKLPTTRV